MQPLQRNETSSKEILSGSNEKPSIKRASVTFIVCLILLCITTAAQEVRSEVSVQGTGFFTKDSSNNGIDNKATETGGVLIGYRYNITRWLAAETNYGYARNTQQYFGGTSAREQANVHQTTGSAVVKLPGFGTIFPYVLAGGGGLIFDPTGDAGGTIAGATRETKGAFLYGGGADYFLMRHVSLRAEYRGFVYKAPSFNLSSLHSDGWTHTAQPSAGLVFRF
jgi:outer membrane immunogenic protein